MHAVHASGASKDRSLGYNPVLEYHPGGHCFRRVGRGLGIKLGINVGILEGGVLGAEVGAMVGTKVGIPEGGLVGAEVGAMVGDLVAEVIFTAEVETLTPRTLPTLLEKLESEMLLDTVVEADVLADVPSLLRPSMWKEPISKYVFQVVVPRLLVDFMVVAYSFTWKGSTPIAEARC